MGEDTDKAAELMETLRMNPMYNTREFVEAYGRKYTWVWFKSMAWPMQLFLVIIIILTFYILYNIYSIFTSLPSDKQIPVVISLVSISTIIALDYMDFI